MTKLIRLPELMELLQVSRTWIYNRTSEKNRLFRQNNFPLPIKLGAKTIAWNRNEIEQWIFEQSNNRNFN